MKAEEVAELKTLFDADYRTSFGLTRREAGRIATQ